MGQPSPSNFAPHQRTDEVSVHTTRTVSDFLATSVSTKRPLPPSRIPQLSRRAMSSTSVKNVPRYMMPTLASSQRQRAPIPKRSALGKSVNAASSQPPTERMSRKQHMSNIPVLSRGWVETALARRTLAQVPQVSVQRVPASRLISTSPPPTYEENPEARRQYNAAILLVSPPFLSPKCLPVYLKDPSGLEVELFIYHYLQEELEDSGATTPSHGFLPECSREILHTPKARLACVRPNTHGREARSPEGQSKQLIPSSSEGLSESSERRSLSCDILEDIFLAFHSSSLRRAVVLSTSVQSYIISFLVNALTRGTLRFVQILHNCLILIFAAKLYIPALI
ncbi:hypothetical protein B0J17DRAFT_767809 [Rhizoctonia solani]|nr:hypothetical protein B0J17DRAFT_767809 [Rhizoctonia solani]